MLRWQVPSEGTQVLQEELVVLFSFNLARTVQWMGATTVYNMDSKYDDTSDIYKMIYNKNNAVHVDHSPW